MNTDKNITLWKNRLVTRAAHPYQAAGRFAWHFARGKLGGDPVFTGILRHGLIAPQSHILDLGCGQGLLAAWLLAAHQLCSDGDWPKNFPPAPEITEIRGIELMPRDVQRGKLALGTVAGIEQGDIRRADFGRADVVVILDVLHYMDVPAQDAVLQRVRAALGSSGKLLLLRIGDADRGWPFLWSRWVDVAVAFMRGHGHVRLYCRSLAQWVSALQSLGFTVETVPMSQGTPFANMLLVCRC